MAKKKSPDAAAQLAEQLVAALQRRREGSGPYPCTLQELSQDIEQDVPESLLSAATGKAPFKTKTVVAIAGNPSLPVVLKEDAAKLAEQAPVLHALCERLCSPESPLLDLTSASKLLTNSLRKNFVAHWQSQAAANSLPDFVSVTTLPAAKGKGKGKKTSLPILHDKRFPLPWVELSQKLVGKMEQRVRNGIYLVGWSDLVKAIEKDFDRNVLQQARECDPFASRVIEVFPKSQDELLTLRDAASASVSDDRIVNQIYDSQKKTSDDAVDITSLAKPKQLNPELLTAWSSFLNLALAKKQLPTGFVLVRLGTKKYLLRVRDLLPSGVVAGARESVQPSTETVTIPPKEEAGITGRFETDFEAAFTTLDRSHGMRNFLKLYELRNALPQYSREQFDRGLRELRLQRRFTLESSEGNRVVLTPEEREAGINEGGLQLIYCRRRD